MGQTEYTFYIPPNVTVASDGSIADMTDVYEFDDRDTLFELSFTGWGMPGIEYITQQGPFEHGVSVLDYRLQPRIIQLVHKRLGCSRQNYWDNRSLLIDALRPNRQLANSFSPGRLRKVLPNGEFRDLLVFIDSGPKFAPRGISEWNEYDFNETLRFIAHNPIVFNPAQESASWALENLQNLIFYETPDWTNRLVFEGDGLFSGGIWFGETSLGDVLNITYTGTWLSYPTIYITGPLNLPRILNNTTGNKIEFDYNVSDGETIIINLEYGQKTVTNNFGTNLIGTVTTDSDVAEFAIVPDPEAINGVNQLQVFGDDAEIGKTEVRITWNTNYIGI